MGRMREHTTRKTKYKEYLSVSIIARGKEAINAFGETRPSLSTRKTG